MASCLPLRTLLLLFLGCRGFVGIITNPGLEYGSSRAHEGFQGLASYVQVGF